MPGGISLQNNRKEMHTISITRGGTLYYSGLEENVIDKKGEEVRIC
jgi:hypothetical protein